MSHTQAHPARPDRGFTLIELMTVVAIVAIISAIVVPNILGAKRNANEDAAIATLKNISSSQAQCMASAVIDDNNNGTGEYGYFGELSGAAFVRENGGLSAAQRLNPPTLSMAYSQVAGSRVVRSGYTFQIYLPNAAAGWVPEAVNGGAVSGSVGPATAEALWACFAWPSSYPNSGRRAFFINQDGDLLSCRNSVMNYSGSTVAPIPGRYGMLSNGADMSGTVATNATGADGERWFVVN